MEESTEVLFYEALEHMLFYQTDLTKSRIFP
jgi:hypothetical protein